VQCDELSDAQRLIGGISRGEIEEASMERSITSSTDTRRSSLLTILGSLCVAFLASPASAEAMRTWVSAAGDDMRSCSRTEPCRSFNRAIQEAAAGGEINCIDAGEYSTFSLTINKSITIDCEGTYGGIHAAPDRVGININAPDVVVTLRNLTIRGAGTGATGVLFSQHGSTLRIENSRISGFRTGIHFVPAVIAKLYIVNTTISENENGILIVPAPLGMGPTGNGGADVAFNQVRVQNNIAGIMADAEFGRIKLYIQDSEVSGNAKNGIHAKSKQPASVVLDRTMCVNNGIGVVAEGAGAKVTVGRSTLRGNRQGAVAAVSGGRLESYKTNNFDDSTPNQHRMVIIEQR
jgi:Right handed beta helix region